MHFKEKIKIQLLKYTTFSLYAFHSFHHYFFARRKIQPYFSLKSKNRVRRANGGRLQKVGAPDDALEKFNLLPDAVHHKYLLEVH